MYYEGIFDTHAHYDDARYDENRAETLKAQRRNGVVGIINCGSDEASSQKSAELAEAFDFVYAGAGVHPEEAGKVTEGWPDRIAELAKRPKTVAIAEIGLDYYWPEPSRDVQREVFTKQLELAAELGMPVEIHDRDAHGDMLEILKRYRPKGCLHRFSGSLEMAREVVKLGMSLGIGGALTYKNSKKEKAVAAEIPLEYLLLETDCPYLSPEPFRGRTCTSDMLWAVADELAALRRGVAAEEIVNVTRDNARRLFSIR